MKYALSLLIMIFVVYLAAFHSPLSEFSISQVQKLDHNSVFDSLCTAEYTEGDVAYGENRQGFPFSTTQFTYDDCHYAVKADNQPLLIVANVAVLTSAVGLCYLVTRRLLKGKINSDKSVRS